MFVCLYCCKDKDSDTDTIYFNPKITYGNLMDQDGNIYKTVTIGNQTWMAENLRVTIFRNGDTIRHVADNSWDDLTSGAYCNYNNEENLHKAGRLYNWYAVIDPRNLAPEGWHIPSDSEWTALTTFLGEENAGGKLKEAGLAHWFSPNTGADNSSGFTALPAGARYEENFFFGRGMSTGYWSTTETDSFEAWYRGLSSNYEKTGKYFYSKKLGLSVRCVKD
jgi:uncharacterized protein (TIGR02145 family)